MFGLEVEVSRPELVAPEDEAGWPEVVRPQAEAGRQETRPYTGSLGPFADSNLLHAWGP